MFEVLTKLRTGSHSANFDTREIEAMISALDKSQAIIQFDPNGKILNANENFLKAMGYQIEEIQGKHHRMFVDAEYAESLEYKSFWQALTDGKFQSAEYKRLGKNGREVWLQASYKSYLRRIGKSY